LDFDHVNYVHKKCYAYCRLIARHRGVSLLEYGVYHIPGIPWVTHYTLYHVFQPPDTVEHFARTGGRGPWTKSIMRVADLPTAQGPATQYDHSYRRLLPLWMKPFQSVLRWWITRWVDILWEEDRSIVERRHHLVQAGFRDSDACAEWVYEQGTGR
jgi:hypothetical protein